jgi:putative ABC transport system substrate-binding protein
MNLRLAALMVAAALLLIPVGAEAQQPGKLPRIGILIPTAPPPPSHPYVEHLLQRLRALGYEDGKSAAIEIRYGDNNPDRVAEMAGELVRLQVEVIATGGDVSTRAAQRATTTIPIVAVVGTPVESGFVASLGQPGGNITAVATQSDELILKRLELLKQAVPRMTRVALLWVKVVSERQLRETEAGARSLGLQLQLLQVRAPADLPGAFEAATRSRAEGLLVQEGPMLTTSREAVVALAAKHRIPAVYARRENAELGGLMSYGASYADMARAVGEQIDRILKGAKPADLPVQQLRKIDLVINLKTARALGLKLPQALVQRADEVIQ